MLKVKPTGQRGRAATGSGRNGPKISFRRLYRGDILCPVHYDIRSVASACRMSSETGARLMKAFTGRRRHSNSARTCHPPPLRSIHIQPLLCANP